LARFKLGKQAEKDVSLNMAPLRLAIATRCLNCPLKPALLLAAKFGAAGVQFDARAELKPDEMSATGQREFRHILQEVGLSIASLDFPTRRPLCDPDRLDARLDALKKVMEFAYQVDARTVTLRLGGLPQDADEAGRRLMLSVLDDLARHANRVGVTLALGAGRESAARLAELLNSVKSGPIGVNFDPATAVAAGQDPAAMLRSFSNLVAHVMVRDAVHLADGAGDEVPVGRGEVPWNEMLALLHEMDYRGWLTVDRTQGEDRAGDAERAIQFLQSIYRG